MNVKRILIGYGLILGGLVGSSINCYFIGKKAGTAKERQRVLNILDKKNEEMKQFVADYYRKKKERIWRDYQKAAAESPINIDWADFPEVED